MDKFFGYLKDLAQSYNELAVLLEQKMEAAEAFDVEKIEEIMKREQVIALVSRGFEANMDSHKSRLGLTGDKLSDLIGQLPPDQQPRFRNVHNALSEALELCNGLNEKCQKLIENKLYAIEKNLQEQGKTVPYGENGKNPGASQPRILSTTI